MLTGAPLTPALSPGRGSELRLRGEGRTEASPPPLSLLRKTPFDPERTPAPEDDPDPLQKEDHRLLCAACGHPVTDEREAVSVEGSQVHRRVNPHGFVFVFGCFRSARGAKITGDPTLEHTWFPGFAWSFAQCRHCEAHLGWAFERGSEGFVALILDRITRPH